MNYENIIVARDAGVATITLNRPRTRNALNEVLGSELLHAVRAARHDEEVRAIVLTGAGGAFCAGGDVGAMEARTGVEEHGYVRQAAQVVAEIANAEKPVIAMVNGPAVGGGCNIALACDIVIAAEESRFGEVYVRLGIVPDLGGLFLLPRLVGLHKAKELIFTGDLIDGREAERIGLINKAVPAAELESTVMALAHRLAKGPTKAHGLAKLLLHRALTTDLAGAIELEALGLGICLQTEDFKEGARAFLEKRTPEFKGR